MEVLRLLKSKNRCLRRLLDVSTAFLGALEKGDLSGLGEFEQQREAIIRALELYDRKASDLATLLPSHERTPALIEGVSMLLAEKDGIIQAIISQDSRILEALEGERSQVLRDMAVNHKSSETMKKFKSSWVPSSGEGIDQKL